MKWELLRAWLKIRRLRSLEYARKRMLCEAVLLPLLIQASFRLCGVPRTQAWLRRWASRATRNQGASAERIIKDARWAQAVVQRSLGIAGTCLVRSLTLWAVLLRFGVETDLRVGFRKRDTKTEGHAWLELKGRPINEAPGEVETYADYGQPFQFDRWSR